MMRRVEANDFRSAMDLLPEDLEDEEDFLDMEEEIEDPIAEIQLVEGRYIVV
jgi:hypothetical protein